jgi:hypothetical protein
LDSICGSVWVFVWCWNFPFKGQKVK